MWSLNTTFIVLVLKKGEVEDPIDFRPISLVGSLYKLIEKVLASRLKKVMSKLVKKPPKCLRGGSKILDASLIANEVMRLNFEEKGKEGLL